MKLLVFISCVCAVLSAEAPAPPARPALMSPVRVKVYGNSDALSTINLGPDGDIFNVRGFQWKCPTLQQTVLPVLSDLTANAFPPQGLRVNALLECLKFFPAQSCLTAQATAPIPLWVNLIEGSSRQVVTDTTTLQSPKPSVMNFFVGSLCPGALALPAMVAIQTGQVAKLNAEVVSAFMVVTVKVTLTAGQIGSFLFEGNLVGTNELSVTGDTATVNAYLAKIMFLPATNGTQVIKVTLISPSGSLTGYQSVMATTIIPSPQPVIASPVAVSPIPSPDAEVAAILREVVKITPDQPGRVGTTSTFSIAGDIADFSEANVKSQLSSVTGVPADFIEIISARQGSVIVDWRFNGLSQTKEALAKAQLVSYCKAVLAKQGVDCDSIRDANTGGGGGSILKSGPIIGIVLGIVGAIGLLVAIGLLASAYSKKAAGMPAKSLYGEDFYGVANPGFDAPPPTPDVKYIGAPDAKYIP